MNAPFRIPRLRIDAYRMGDAAGLELCAAQARDFAGAVLTEAVDRMAVMGSAFTLRDMDGRVLLIAGIAQIDPGYGHCWTFQSRHSGPWMLRITRAVAQYLDLRMAKHRRLEMMVRADFAQAHRWARLLGFTDEGVMDCAAPDGCDMVRFGRVNRAAIFDRPTAALHEGGL